MVFKETNYKLSGVVQNITKIKMTANWFALPILGCIGWIFRAIWWRIAQIALASCSIYPIIGIIFFDTATYDYNFFLISLSTKFRKKILGISQL